MQYRVHFLLSAEAEDGTHSDQVTISSHGAQDGANPADALRRAAAKAEQYVKDRLGESK